MRHFDVEINDLQNRLVDMAALVQKMIRAATQKLVGEESKKQSDFVFHLEKKVNIQEIIIDDKCLKLIALNQPVGIDLRFITSAMRINSDLERMGDEAVNISRMTSCLIEYPEFIPPIDISKMIEIVQNMVMDCIKSFNTNNAELALSVLTKDGEVDRLRDGVLDNIKNLMIEFPDINAIRKAVDLIFITKSIERLGDHATNISEDIIFMIYGKDVRHLRSEQQIH
ncbi:MAG: phosphate signaling complex protein PhoU [Endomicrobium sp.]|jgi:phosphate transport system protein|nr:phosphate signaling complex protein PhoU [Endomicrobium sp.]